MRGVRRPVVAQFARARGGGISLTVGVSERRILARIFTEMLELVGDEDEPTDPLAAVLGVGRIGTSTSAPEDPALARLFPDGYTDDPEASADFRRYTEPSLRAAKRLGLRTALETIAEPGRRRMVITFEQADLWLRAINDTRLVLGERLHIDDDWDLVAASLPQDDARHGIYWVYDWLTYLQETLVRSLL